jgi:hypothetical protein
VLSDGHNQSQIESQPDGTQCQVMSSPPRYDIAIDRGEGRPVVRLVKELHLHPALEKFGWAGLAEEFNDAVRSATSPFIDQAISLIEGF